MTIEPLNTDKETAQLNMMKIIWLGLVFYPCVLVVVALKVLPAKEVGEFNEEIFFQIGAIIALFASHMYPKYLLKNIQNQKQNQNQPRSELEKIKTAFVPFVIALAISETVVVLGFVLVVLSGQPNKILPFAMAGIFNIICLYPKREKILAQI